MKPALAFLLLALAASPQDKSVPKELQDKINKAIDKGVKYLKGRVAAGNPEGKRTFEEKRPLIALALMKSGVKKEDAQIQAIKREMLAAADKKLAGIDAFSQMYQAGIMAMALAEFEDAPSKKAVQEIANLVGRSQLASGSWGYTVGTPDKRDNASTAQYALLALQAAANRGCALPEGAIAQAARYFLGMQRPDGGWTYHGNIAKEQPHGSVSAIGVASLVICRSNLGPGHELTGKIDAAIAKGLEWLGKNFSASEHPGKTPWQGAKDALWLYYYLYSVERAGMFARVEKMGAHDWYAEGAEFLVRKQRANGSWEQTHERHEDDDIATCFALLFLARASGGMIPTEPAKK
ncbi:MAG TPA: prenyltransferase/squalene oxidase repeat-containing protein [Planctomycetota bacterium]|nr:prenyltransferase/squalene oxidase repeat-containing protein [Planctomycetota bacterium]